MKSQTVVIEISNKFIKIVIGKVCDERLCVTYVKKVPTGRLLENGTIKDKTTLINELVKLNPLLDEKFHINQMLDDVVLVLPPYGLEIYKTQQLTTVISPEKVIGLLDIKNIYSIIKNKKLPNENDLINILIDSFTIDSGEQFFNPPIGKPSTAISADSKVLTLPKRINNEFSSVLNKSGIKVGQKVVSSSCAVELLKHDDSIPASYYLVDIGSNSTCVSLVGNGELLATRSFSWGGDFITDKLIAKYNISEAAAERVKTVFGIDKREMDFKFPVIEKTSEDTTNHYQNEINETIEEELKQFLILLLSSMDQLKNLYNVNNFNLPLVLIGGTSKLHGLDTYLKENLSNDKVIVATPKVIGARDSSLCAVLGAVLLYNKYLTGLDFDTAVNVFREE